MTLRDVLNRMKRTRLDLSDGYLFVLSAALNWFADGPVDGLTAVHVCDMMRRMPHTRRDKFHRIRKTSYTLVAVKFGTEAASENAAHVSDISEFYFDRSFLPKPNPLDALPRPQ